MQTHSNIIIRPYLGEVVKKVYMNKFTAKSYAPWLYSGETNDNYFNYRSFQTSIDKLKLNDILAQKKLEAKKKSNRKLILGLECSFNDSCASIVSSTGQILANKSSTLPITNKPNGPILARDFHRETLPTMVE